LSNPSWVQHWCEALMI